MQHGDENFPAVSVMSQPFEGACKSVDGSLYLSLSIASKVFSDEGNTSL